MTTMRTILMRALTGAALVAVAPATALAHPGEGPAGFLHDLLHGLLLGPGHELRAVGLLLLLLGAAALVSASLHARSPGRRPLRAAGSAAVLAGLALALV